MIRKGERSWWLVEKWFQTLQAVGYLAMSQTVGETAEKSSISR